ncbi:MAG TPA: TIGR02444 family protein [Rhodocyclaceae bacterium]|nr:TIGR02444 family protein [Rhodocyclaceae bacterium]
MKAAKKTHPFWTFSLALYARAGVEPACLALQESGADVNLLLLCCWLGANGRQLDSSALERLRQAASPWQEEVLSPLRRARRAVKSGIAGMAPEWGAQLKHGILTAELDAEYLEQLFLAGLAVPLAAPARGREQAAADNLGRYLGLLAIDAAVDGNAQLLLSACASCLAPPG